MLSPDRNIQRLRRLPSTPDDPYHADERGSRHDGSAIGER